MALAAAPKVSLHLYLNNPYGLLSATIPHYNVKPVDVPADGNASRLTLHEPLPDIKRVEPPSVTKINDLVDLDSNVSTNTKTTTSRVENKALSQRTARKKNKSPQNGGAQQNGGSQVQTSEALGITWSINLDKREKMTSPRKPPPPTLLEKLGRVKLPVEPVGVVKIKRKAPPTFPPGYMYNIQKLQLADKGQRKMTEKLSEWLDQYNEVSQKQRDYLGRIHDLRRSLQHKDEKRIVVTIDNMRANEKQRYRRKYPVYTMSKMEETAMPQGPAPFPNRPCLFHTDEGQTREQKIKIAPRGAPRKLAPIVKKVNGKRSPKMIEIASSEDSTPRPEMSKMRTEYEPFESIAKRNKLSLTQFFNSSLSHRRTNKRQPLNVSTVTIINEVAEENDANANDSPVAYITDVSLKKSIKIKDGKPD